MDNTVSVELDFPVTVTLKGGGNKSREEVVDSITLRRPKVKDLKGINLEALQGDDLVTMVMRLANLDRQVVSEIDVADFLKISQVIGDFFPKPSSNNDEESESSGA